MPNPPRRPQQTIAQEKATFNHNVNPVYEQNSTKLLGSKSVKVYVQEQEFANPLLIQNTLKAMTLSIDNMGGGLTYGYDTKKNNLKQIQERLTQTKTCTLDELADKIAQFQVVTRKPRSNYLSFLFKPAKENDTESSKAFLKEIHKIYNIYPNLEARVEGFLTIRMALTPEENLANKQEKKL